MPYDEQRFERYAMQAELMSQEAEQGGIDIDAVGKAIGMTQEESREYACYLRDQGWARVMFVDPPRLWITSAGHAEIPKLRLPRWRRSFNKNLAVIISIFIACISLVLSILQWIFR